MIVRIWHGVTPEAKADQYLDYLKATGVKGYRAIEGNKGVQVLRSVREGHAEFLTVSYWEIQRDRKSTRLNSSHTVISYAVFCLKKKMHATDVLTSTVR